jgi:hypothetical protein
MILYSIMVAEQMVQHSWYMMENRLLWRRKHCRMLQRAPVHGRMVEERVAAIHHAAW